MYFVVLLLSVITRNEFTIFLLCVSDLMKIAPLVSTSLRKFKIFQAKEQCTWINSLLMGTCFLLLPTIMGTLGNWRRAPKSTRWTSWQENSPYTRPYRLEEPVALSTFQSLVNISLLFLMFTMEHISWTLQSTNGMESCLSTFRKYLLTEQPTSPISR